MKMYIVCTSLSFPSLPFSRFSTTVVIKRERKRLRQSINFTYPRELVDIKTTNSQPKYQVVDKNLNGRGAVYAGKLHFTSLTLQFQKSAAQLNFG
jgi:hypothetical protein